MKASRVIRDSHKDLRKTKAGHQRTLTYDDAGRLTKLEWDGTTDKVELAYDSLGRLTTATDTRLPLADLGGQSFVYGYGADDRLTTVTYPDGETMGYGFDQYGRRASMTDPDGNQTGYAYNTGATDKRLSQVTHPLLGDAQYSYYPDGLLEWLYYGSNGDVHIYDYDSRKRLSGITHYSDQTGLDYRSEDYTYNDASVRTRIDVTEGLTSSRMEYGYDSLLRLTGEYRFTGSTQDWGRKYAFDAAGNRTSLARHNGSTTTSVTYDAANNWNQILADSEHDYLYDDDGNMTVKAVDGSRYYEHDREGRLTAVTRLGATVRYAYDSSGRMLLRVAPDGSKEKYYYDGLTRVLVKESPSGGSVWRTKRVYAVKPGAIGQVYGKRENTAWSTGGTPTAWTDRWLHYDMLGNLVIKTDEYGAVTDRYQMDAYGNVLSGNPNGIHLTTKERDPDTGLYWFGARWYDPATGRWLQKEPTGADGPNLYHFVFNRPTFAFDSDGRKTQSSGQQTINNHSGACGNAPALPANSGICDIYCPSERYSGVQAKCVCEGAGDSPWDQCVRGCLACNYLRAGRKVSPAAMHQAHLSCFKACDSKLGGSSIQWTWEAGPAAVGCMASEVIPDPGRLHMHPTAF